MSSAYESELAAWKAKHGLEAQTDYGQDEMAMIAEDQASKKTSWCLGCDKEMPVSKMKLITRRIDPYVQIDESAGDYIAKRKRVRMCPDCFLTTYGDSETTEK